MMALAEHSALSTIILPFFFIACAFVVGNGSSVKSGAKSRGDRGDLFRFDLSTYPGVEATKNNNQQQLINWNGKPVGLIASKDFHGFRTLRGELPITAGNAAFVAKDKQALLYYFEIKVARTEGTVYFGLCAEDFPLDDRTIHVGQLPNSYAISSGHGYYGNGTRNDAVFNSTEYQFFGLNDVVGCGMRTNANEEGKPVELFFTRNGAMLVKPIPIAVPDVPLYPAVSLWGHTTIEANFGGSVEFKYNLQNFEADSRNGSPLSEGAPTTKTESELPAANANLNEEEPQPSLEPQQSVVVPNKVEPSKTKQPKSRFHSFIGRIFSSRIGSSIGVQSKAEKAAKEKLVDQQMELLKKELPQIML